MKQKKLVSMIGALILVIGAVVLVGCKQAQGDKTNSDVPVVVHVESVTLDKQTLSIMKGQKDELNETVLPADASNKAVTWESSDTTIATVSKKGLVHGLKAGTVTITVKTVDGEKTATCELTVTVPGTPSPASVGGRELFGK